MKRMTWVLACTVAVCGMVYSGVAQSAEPAPDPEPVVVEEPAGPPPFPLHTVEGSGGVILVPTAYLCNPPAEGEAFGKPAVGSYYANLDEKDLTAFTLTETVRVADTFDLEFGYAYTSLQLGKFRPKLIAAALPNIGTNHAAMHTLSVRTPLIRENAGGMNWVPAVTVGAHYKHNNDIAKINRRLGGALTARGYRSDSGVEFTIVASKTLIEPIGNRPMIVSLCTRFTEASQIGLTGFTNSYSPELEASVVYLLTGNLALAAEYRSKPDEITELPGLIESEEDWWDVGLAYLVNEHLSFTAGYVQWGNVLDEHCSGGWIAGMKWEF